MYAESRSKHRKLNGTCSCARWPALEISNAVDYFARQTVHKPAKDRPHVDHLCESRNEQENPVPLH